jgi:hypothetical protein
MAPISRCAEPGALSVSRESNAHLGTRGNWDCRPTPKVRCGSAVAVGNLRERRLLVAVGHSIAGRSAYGRTPARTSLCGGAVRRGAPSLGGTVRLAAQQARKFRHRCTQMHADLPESGMLVHGKHRPTEPGEPRRRVGPRPIGVHLCASVVKFSCFLRRAPQPAARDPGRTGQPKPHATERPGRGASNPPSPAHLTAQPKAHAPNHAPATHTASRTMPVGHAAHRWLRRQNLMRQNRPAGPRP